MNKRATNPTTMTDDGMPMLSNNKWRLFRVAIYCMHQPCMADVSCD